MSDTLCPVFCIADLPVEIVNKFFEVANKSTDEHCYEAPVGLLVTSTQLPEDIDENGWEIATRPPLDERALDNNYFLGMSYAQVVRWALDLPPASGIIRDQMVILDERTKHDETCLLLSRIDGEQGLDEAPDHWISVRSDFESSILTIMTKYSGCGGDEHFETSLKGGFDGVLSIAKRNAEEAESYPIH